MSILNTIRHIVSKVTTPLSLRRGVGGEAILLLLLSCQSEDAPLSPTVSKGRIALTFSDVAAYVDVETRAEHPLENVGDYDFTISGTTAEDVTITDQPLSITSGEAVIDAGTYTLHVQGNSTLQTASTNGLGTPYYAGTSVDASGNTTTFTVTAGGLTSVRVLLRPANAKLTIHLDKSFTDLYKSATLSTGSRAITLIGQADTDTPPATATDIVAYFDVPASGTLSYTLAAYARSGTKVTDIGATENTIPLAAATHTTLSLSANTLTGEIIPTVTGDHTGEFD